MNVNAKRDNSRIKEIEIMDCTLRDGEQTNGVSFLPHEKLMIARMLLHDITKPTTADVFPLRQCLIGQPATVAIFIVNLRNTRCFIQR